MPLPTAEKNNSTTDIRLAKHGDFFILSAGGREFQIAAEEMSMIRQDSALPSGLRASLAQAGISESAVIEAARAMSGNSTGLSPNMWFVPAAKGLKFIPYNCARDYLNVFPHVITEYQNTMHQFT